MSNVLRTLFDQIIYFRFIPGKVGTSKPVIVTGVVVNKVWKEQSLNALCLHFQAYKIPSFKQNVHWCFPKLCITQKKNRQSQRVELCFVYSWNILDPKNINLLIWCDWCFNRILALLDWNYEICLQLQVVSFGSEIITPPGFMFSGEL